MAQNAPTATDVQDIQFKLHDKFSIFPEGKELKSLVSLLAVSSTKGLLFAGNPYARELKVVKLKDVVDSKSNCQDLPVRVIPLPAEPRALACSCDGSMLAVNYLMNNTGFLQVFQVESFVTPKINSLYHVPVSPESYVFALQLLWNPVLANNIALVLNDGSVSMFTLSSGGQYDKLSLGKEHQIRSGCWSPKGKQIVFGFAEGKLQQFKPNLQPARAIPCPTGIHPGPFDCIAVHWLSTFQFAAIFLQRGGDMCPSLFIINAPKVGNPSYINYFDICYSSPGPRTQQLSFNHIAQWNLLLVSSANGIEVGILGTNESSENPTWTQYTLLDEARIEMPLTEAKDETYSVGFAFDTSSSHRVQIGEQTLPAMPMVHVLSTHGHLVSFNFLNLSPNTVDVCSPPPPLNDISGQFRAVRETCKPQREEPDRKQSQIETVASAVPQIPTGNADMTFTLGANMVTSTPAIKDNPAPMFGSLATSTAKPTVFGHGATSAAPTTAPIGSNKSITGSGSSAAAVTSGFGAQTVTPSFGGFGGGATGFAAAKPADKQQPSSVAVSTRQSPADITKPLYTVPPTFKPPSVTQSSKQGAAQPKVNINTGDIDEVVKQMIAIQIDAFEGEIKQISMQSKRLMENIGKPEEIRSYTSKLNDLQEIIEQANDYEFEQDVQSLRHSMNEAYAMLAECRTKFDMYNNPNLSRLTAVPSADPTNRLQLAKLQSLATINQTQLSQLNLLLDAQWSQYQDIVRRNTKNHMHIPCLDGVYQRMSKIKDLLTRQRTKLNHIKTKLKLNGLSYKPPSDLDITTAAVGALRKNQSTMESLADSILTMSLLQVVSQTHAKLSEDKLCAIRNFTKQHQQIAIIRPKRPDRVGLKSEVILETKMETERKQKEQARQKQKQMPVQKSATNLSMQKEMQQLSMHPTQISNISSLPKHAIGMPNPQQQSLLAKPTASKPPLISNPPQPATFITPTSSTSSGLTFGSSSSFVKTSAAAASNSFPAFGATQGQTFGQSKIGSDHKADNKENIATNTPISFSPKVIGGNSAKPTVGSLSSKALLATDEGGADSNQRFAAFTPNKPPHAGDSLSKDNTKQEQAIKTFSFGGIVSNLSSSANTSSFPTGPAPSFGGFGSLSKSPASTVSAVSSSTGGGVFSSAMFGSQTNFTALSTTSAVPLNTSTSFSFTGSSKTSTGTVSSSTSSNAPITNPNAINAGMTNDAATTAKPFQAPTSSTTSFGNVDVGISLINNGTIDSNSTTKSTAPPNVVIGSKSVSAANPATSEPLLLSPSSTLPKADATDALLALNICKPDTKQGGDVAKSGASIFSGFGAQTSTASASGPFAFATASGAGDGCTSFLSSSATSATSTGFSFGMGTTKGNNNIFGKSETETLTKSEITTTSSASPGLTAATTSSSPASPSIVASAPCSTSASLFSQSTTSNASGFGSLSLGGTTVSSSPTATSTAATGNIFGDSTGASIFGQTSAASTAATTATTSVFGGTAASASSGQPSLGSTVPASAAAATAGAGSLFGGNAVTSSTPSSGSIFGGIPKPDPSVFASSTNATVPPVTGLFAAAAASTNLPAAAGGGNIFGGNSMPTGFGAPAAATAGGSIFGGSTASSPFAAPATANNASSIFGGTKPAESTNVFASPTQLSAASGGSLFGKTAFGQPGATSPQSGGSIFGGATTQPSPGGGFSSSGGSIFGGGSASSNQASGGSIFGPSAAATSPLFGASSTPTGFGSFSQTSNAPAFGSPSGGFGAPTGGGFSSPTQQSAFAKPVFGGPPTFGSPPAFGAQPTFGGAPTFGSPKGFGAFGTTSPTGGVFGGNASSAAAAPAPNGNIFETLGSTNSGLSFGNLAHNTQQPAQQKPAFGGSSFMSYRS